MTFKLIRYISRQILPPNFRSIPQTVQLETRSIYTLNCWCEGGKWLAVLEKNILMKSWKIQIWGGHPDWKTSWCFREWLNFRFPSYTHITCTIYVHLWHCIPVFVIHVLKRYTRALEKPHIVLWPGYCWSTCLVSLWLYFLISRISLFLRFIVQGHNVISLFATV